MSLKNLFSGLFENNYKTSGKIHVKEIGGLVEYYSYFPLQNITFGEQKETGRKFCDINGIIRDGDYVNIGEVVTKLNSIQRGIFISHYLS